ncbi:MAG: hypothetical protein MZV64_23745 [Ignavibacteriales bacterium]|nr:hypothetical protein [Ignavibacteriales bacterium]
MAIPRSCGSACGRGSRSSAPWWSDLLTPARAAAGLALRRATRSVRQADLRLPEPGRAPRALLRAVGRSAAERRLRLSAEAERVRGGARARRRRLPRLQEGAATADQAERRAAGAPPEAVPGRRWRARHRRAAPSI